MALVDAKPPSAVQQLAAKVAGPPNQDDGQDVKTVKILRISVGVIGASLPLTLIIWNAIKGAGTIVPASMSGTYYTSARNLFVGSLCALGVFLFGYRHTTRQNWCTSFAGVCAVLVAFSPTAPAKPLTEPDWVNYLHHAAAIALIGTLGLFCWIIFFATHPERIQRAGSPDAGPLRTWLAGIRATLQQSWKCRIYFSAGLLVLISGLLAVYTGVWPTGWSTGWPSLYLFEGIAVFSFGVAWFVSARDLKLTALDLELTA
jgi:hypothetical protein